MPLPTFVPPTNSLGADLLWWRTSNGMRTVITLFWGRAQQFEDAVHVQAVLFDEKGDLAVTWRLGLQKEIPLFLDSAADGPWRQAPALDGLLALYVCTDGEPSAEARQHYNRLFPLIEWHQLDGRVAILHSDQVVRRDARRKQQLTEIVVSESPDEANALVLLNGEQSQAENALELTIRNMSGLEQTVRYSRAMTPFSVHRIPLAEMFPDLRQFSLGQPLLVSGQFSSLGLFARPYIETTGRRWGAYHGGDVYSWPELPYFAHMLIGGEVNPAAVIHDEQTHTIVNILHSHGALDSDVKVDAALYNSEGSCVARRYSWQIALRNGLANVDVSELIPDPHAPFWGHIALSFSPEKGASVPRRLQALMEYRNSGSVARIMTWSDEWNSRVKIARREQLVAPPIYRSFFRVLPDSQAITEFSITNAGHSGYDRTAEIRAIFLNAEGQRMEANFALAPYATRFTTLAQLFSEVARESWSSGAGVLLLESTSDLASIGFIAHSDGRSLAAEHFLCLYSEHDGEYLLPAGS